MCRSTCRPCSRCARRDAPRRAEPSWPPRSWLPLRGHVNLLDHALRNPRRQLLGAGLRTGAPDDDAFARVDLHAGLVRLRPPALQVDLLAGLVEKDPHRQPHLPDLGPLHLRLLLLLLLCHCSPPPAPEWHTVAVSDNCGPLLVRHPRRLATRDPRARPGNPGGRACPNFGRIGRTRSIQVSPRHEPRRRSYGRLRGVAAGIARAILVRMDDAMDAAA